MLLLSAGIEHLKFFYYYCSGVILDLLLLLISHMQAHTETHTDTHNIRTFVCAMLYEQYNVWLKSEDDGQHFKF